MPFTVKAHGRSSSSRCAGTTTSSRGRGRRSGRTRSSSGSEHIRDVLADVVGWSSACESSRRESTSRSSVPSRTTSRSRDCSTNLGAIRRVARARSGRGQRGAPPPAVLPAEAPTVVYVGKLSREKGVHLLLEALEGWKRAPSSSASARRERARSNGRRRSALHRRSSTGTSCTCGLLRT